MNKLENIEYKLAELSDRIEDTESTIDYNEEVQDAVRSDLSKLLLERDKLEIEQENLMKQSKHIYYTDFVACKNNGDGVNIALGGNKNYMSKSGDSLKSGEDIHEWNGEAEGTNHRPLASVYLTETQVRNLINNLHNALTDTVHA